jgi:hypothetical protein
MAFYTPEEDKKTSYSDFDEDKKLPYVLLIGDSISQGYTKLVRENLKNVANILRPQTNCGDTLNGIKNINAWLGKRTWDIVHFNWGLHDLCYRHPDSKVYGNRDKINGKISVTPDQYADNLEQLIEIMLPRSKRLIWCNTTYVPEKEAGRHVGDDVKYNNIAQNIMASHDIPTDDLYSLSSSFGPELFVAEGDVHFVPKGMTILARQVSDTIQREIGFLY